MLLDYQNDNYDDILKTTEYSNEYHADFGECDDTSILQSIFLNKTSNYDKLTSQHIKNT